MAGRRLDQQEQFPIVRNLLLAVTWGIAATGYSFLLRHVPNAASSNQALNWTSSIGAIFPAFINLVAFLLQLHTIQLHTPAANRYWERPKDKAIHEGAIALSSTQTPETNPSVSAPRKQQRHQQQLWRQLCIGSAIVQLGFAIGLGRPVVLSLLLLWGGLVVFWQLESLVDILETRFGQSPVPFSVLHLGAYGLVMMAIAGYVTTWDWLRAGAEAPVDLVWFLLLSFLNGMLLRLGRGMGVPLPRAIEKQELMMELSEDLPDDQAAEARLEAPLEEATGQGNTSFADRWGPRRAALLWLNLLLIATVVTGQAARPINWMRPMVGLAVGLLVFGAAIALRFIQRPTALWSTQLGQLSELWNLLTYLGLGLLPFVFAL